jgi:hypothetical protein
MYLMGDDELTIVDEAAGCSTTLILDPELDYDTHFADIPEVSFLFS